MPVRMSSIIVAVVLVISVSCAPELWNSTATGADSGPPRKGSPANSTGTPAAPPDDFYQLPTPLVSGRPGDVIRHEPGESYALPYNISAVRILYHSVNALGQDVAASGVVLIPQDRVPVGGWRMIAWAHPFLGAAQSCAPSLMRSLYDGTLLSMYVNMGYAVVAPDYVGLGTHSRNAALDGRSNALDLIYAVRAARSALADLSAQWIGVGVRDGGLAVLIASEQESRITDAGYLGSIAVDPTLDLKSNIQSAYNKGEDLFPFLAYGLKTLYPDFDVNSILLPGSAAHYSQVSSVCSPVVQPDGNLPSRSPRSGWDNDPAVVSLLKRNMLGSTHAPKPILMITASVPPLTVAETQAIARMCKQGDNVEVESYPVDPQNLFGESVSTQVTWLHARFSGLVPPTTCHK